MTKPPQATAAHRGDRWPTILFWIIVLLVMMAQFGLETLSKGMGLSCDVDGVIARTPWFAGFTSVALLLTLAFWRPARALCAVGYAWALHTMNAGLICLMIHAPSCYTGPYSSWRDLNPASSGSALILLGVAILAVIRTALFLLRRRAGNSMQ